MTMTVQPFTDPALLARCAMGRASTDLAGFTADFPLIKAFWHNDDTVVDGASISIADRIGGVTISGGGSSDTDGWKITSAPVISAGFDLTAYDDVGLVNFLNIAATGFSVTIGAASGGNSALKFLAGAVAAATLDDGTNSVTPAVITTNTAGIHGFVADITGQTCAGVLAYKTGATVESVAEASQVGTIVAPTLSAVYAEAGTGPARRSKWQMLLATANNSLLDIAAAGAWMAANDGYIYPGWLGRS